MRNASTSPVSLIVTVSPTVTTERLATSFNPISTADPSSICDTPIEPAPSSLAGKRTTRRLPRDLALASQRAAASHARANQVRSASENAMGGHATRGYPRSAQEALG